MEGPPHWENTGLFFREGYSNCLLHNENQIQWMSVVLIRGISLAVTGVLMILRPRELQRSNSDVTP